MTTLALLLACCLVPLDRPSQGSEAGSPAVLYVGWNDEFNDAKRWSPLPVDNKAQVDTSIKGRLVLSLGQRPADWPYTYQWSGVTQVLQVDLARYPVVIARLSQVTGYAHLDIEVLNAKGEAVKGFRSSAVNGPGVVTADLGGNLDPAVYSLKLRLIVGGENSGCSASYDWVRCVSKSDAGFLQEHPDFQNVKRRGRRALGR